MIFTIGSNASDKSLFLEQTRYLLPAILIFLVTSTQADLLPGWSISGSNTLRAENYDIDGDAASAPWPEAGSQFYSEFDLNMWRRVSAWESMRIQFSGLANDSVYRSDEQGLVLERGSFFWEKGDADIPFRFQAGDYYANQTPNTIQLGLKGLQVELQPAANQSIQFFSGLPAPDYSNLDSDRGVYTGVSWLNESKTLGAFSLTALHYDRDGGSNQLELTQNLFSLAWYKPFEIGSHALELESELAHISGEHDAAGSLLDGDDNGYFVQLSGRSSPLTYRVLHQRYGEHFRPAGGSTYPNQRASEGHIGWRFNSGVQLRGRLQSFRDNLEGDNPLNTRVAGLSLSGPLWRDSALHGTLDSYFQQREDDDDGLDSDTRHISLTLSAPLSSRVYLRSGFIWTGTEDQILDETSISRQLNLALDTKFEAGGWRGTLTPGLTMRRNTGGRDTTEINPALSLRMSRPNHNLGFSYNWLNQNDRSSASSDTDIQQTAFTYDYRINQHRLGFEFDYFDRDPDSGEDTNAYRVGAYWRYSFDRPAVPASAVYVPTLTTTETSVPSILELSPGTGISQINERLASSRIVPSLKLTDTLVYEAALLEQIDLRQRLAVNHLAGKVDAVVLILYFDEDENPVQMGRDYSKVRNLLLKQYGSPESYQEEGEFIGNLAVKLATGRFERTLQWRTASGYLRFGIPRRLDGRVRMEIRHASTMPAGSMWSIEAIR